MQGWEGEMDTVHAAFLHGGFVNLIQRLRISAPADNPCSQRDSRRQNDSENPSLQFNLPKWSRNIGCN